MKIDRPEAMYYFYKFMSYVLATMAAVNFCAIVLDYAHHYVPFVMWYEVVRLFAVAGMAFGATHCLALAVWELQGPEREAMREKMQEAAAQADMMREQVKAALTKFQARGENSGSEDEYGPSYDS